MEKKSLFRLIVLITISLVLMALVATIAFRLIKNNNYQAELKAAKAKFRVNQEFNILKMKETWYDYNGKKWQLAEFKDKTLIYSFIYFHCRTFCPLIMQDIEKLKTQLTKENNGAKTRYILFLFDDLIGQNSKVNYKKLKKQMQTFYSRYNVSYDDYLLLTSTKKGVEELVGSFKMRYEASGKKDINYMHSNVIAASDRQGKLIFADYGLHESNDTKVEKIISGLND